MANVLVLSEQKMSSALPQAMTVPTLVQTCTSTEECVYIPIKGVSETPGTPPSQIALENLGPPLCISQGESTTDQAGSRLRNTNVTLLKQAFCTHGQRLPASCSIRTSHRESDALSACI